MPAAMPRLGRGFVHIATVASALVLDVLLEVVLPVLMVAAVGGLVGRRFGFDTDTFSKAVFNLFSPCLVFMSIAQIELGASDIGRLVGVAAIVFFANALAAWLWGVLRRADPATRATNILTASVVNQGNMGLPMAKLAFGDAGLQIAVVIFVTGVVLWSSAGIALGSLASSTGSRRRALTAPLRYPSIYATVLGGLVNVTNVKLPVVIAESARTLGQASIPCMLVILGLQFHWPRLDDLGDPLATSVNRLVLGPLVAWPAATALGLRGLTSHTSIMMAGMPTAVMTTILATELAGKPALAVRTVIVTTLLAIPTLTVLIAILR